MREVTRSEKGTDADDYRIWDRLPRETRVYVPLMVATACIAREPARYGFDDVELYQPWELAEMLFDAATPLAQIAVHTGTTVDVIRQLDHEEKSHHHPRPRARRDGHRLLVSWFSSLCVRTLQAGEKGKREGLTPGS